VFLPFHLSAPSSGRKEYAKPPQPLASSKPNSSISLLNHIPQAFPTTFLQKDASIHDAMLLLPLEPPQPPKMTTVLIQHFGSTIRNHTYPTTFPTLQQHNYKLYHLKPTSN
jgi:hypothetical protein